MTSCVKRVNSSTCGLRPAIKIGRGMMRNHLRQTIARVAARVAQGGHHVASGVVRRRFHSGLRNFQKIYKDLVDTWEWYDNSGRTPQLIAEEGSWR